MGLFLSLLAALLIAAGPGEEPAVAGEQPAVAGEGAAIAGENDGAAALRHEVAKKGWIAFSARAPNGTWDIFLSRPDGSGLRNVTNTPDREEAAPLFSNDGKKMLFRRVEKGATISHDLWGFQGRLVVARSDGSDPVDFGADEEFPWATWSPDAKRLACLTLKGIQIVDVETKTVLRTLPRKGVYQQLSWSPDGRWFTGTANDAGEMWCVVRMDAETGAVNPILRFQSCTPDWFPDGKRAIFSSRPAKQSPTNSYGWTQLYMAQGDGGRLELVYGEDGRHVYGGALSPDGAHVLFTLCPEDGGGSERDGAPICLMRLADAPTIGGASPDLRRKYPKTKDGPVVRLHRGWEPCWTFAEVGPMEGPAPSGPFRGSRMDGTEAVPPSEPAGPFRGSRMDGTEAVPPPSPLDNAAVPFQSFSAQVRAVSASS